MEKTFEFIDDTNYRVIIKSDPINLDFLLDNLKLQQESLLVQQQVVANLEAEIATIKGLGIKATADIKGVSL